MSNAYDLAVADMYSDDAKIIVLRNMDGMESTTKMTGKKAKEMIVDQMPIIKESGATNDYSKISIVIDGNKATIRATRYSTLKCFTDDKYYMVVEKNDDGPFQIIEEFVETPIKNLCEHISEKKLSILLKSLAKAANKNLPIKVDTETQLEKISVEGKNFTYHYTMVNFMTSMIDPAKFKAGIVPTLTKQMCSNTSIRTFLDMGAVFVHSYKGKDHFPITDIQVVKSDCKPEDFGT